MKQEDKELLLKDLSGRLPYGVMCNIGLEYPLPLQRIFVDKLDGILLDFYEDGNDYQLYLSEVKPYLRPMSSITDEEKRKIQSFYPGSYGEQWFDEKDGTIEIFECSSTVTLYLGDSIGVGDFLNSHHFDYRGLIEKNLAIEAPEEMYNLK